MMRLVVPVSARAQFVAAAASAGPDMFAAPAILFVIVVFAASHCHCMLAVSQSGENHGRVAPPSF
jgi:hypothetical protein